MGPDGNFVFAWVANSELTGQVQVFVGPFAADGSPLADEILVDMGRTRYSPFGTRFPSVGTDEAGNFAVAWQGDAPTIRPIQSTTTSTRNHSMPPALR